jgi:ABC-type cobalamin/Fe3+-siderophores transport system ATPase subunit
LVLLLENYFDRKTYILLSIAHTRTGLDCLKRIMTDEAKSAQRAMAVLPHLRFIPASLLPDGTPDSEIEMAKKLEESFGVWLSECWIHIEQQWKETGGLHVSENKVYLVLSGQIFDESIVLEDLKHKTMYCLALLELLKKFPAAHHPAVSVEVLLLPTASVDRRTEEAAAETELCMALADPALASVCWNGSLPNLRVSTIGREGRVLTDINCVLHQSMWDLLDNHCRRHSEPPLIPKGSNFIVADALLSWDSPVDTQPWTDFVSFVEKVQPVVICCGLHTPFSLYMQPVGPRGKRVRIMCAPSPCYGTDATCEVLVVHPESNERTVVKLSPLLGKRKRCFKVCEELLNFLRSPSTSGFDSGTEFIILLCLKREFYALSDVDQELIHQKLKTEGLGRIMFRDVPFRRHKKNASNNDGILASESGLQPIALDEVLAALCNSKGDLREKLIRRIRCKPLCLIVPPKSRKEEYCQILEAVDFLVKAEAILLRVDWGPEVSPVRLFELLANRPSDLRKFYDDEVKKIDGYLELPHDTRNVLSQFWSNPPFVTVSSDSTPSQSRPQGLLSEVCMKNFMSVTQETSIDFFSKLDKPGVYQICAVNGTGKSTVFEAICYRLTGRLLRAPNAKPKPIALEKDRTVVPTVQLWFDGEREQEAAATANVSDDQYKAVCQELCIGRWSFDSAMGSGNITEGRMKGLPCAADQQLSVWISAVVKMIDALKRQKAQLEELKILVPEIYTLEIELEAISKDEPAEDEKQRAAVGRRIKAEQQLESCKRKYASTTVESRVAAARDAHTSILPIETVEGSLQGKHKKLDNIEILVTQLDKAWFEWNTWRMNADALDALETLERSTCHGRDQTEGQYAKCRAACTCDGCLLNLYFKDELSPSDITSRLEAARKMTKHYSESWEDLRNQFLDAVKDYGADKQASLMKKTKIENGKGLASTWVEAQRPLLVVESNKCSSQLRGILSNLAAKFDGMPHPNSGEDVSVKHVKAQMSVFENETARLKNEKQAQMAAAQEEMDNAETEEKSATSAHRKLQELLATKRPTWKAKTVRKSELLQSLGCETGFSDRDLPEQIRHATMQLMVLEDLRNQVPAGIEKAYVEHVNGFVLEAFSKMLPNMSSDVSIALANMPIESMSEGERCRALMLTQVVKLILEPGLAKKYGFVVFDETFTGLDTMGQVMCQLLLPELLQAGIRKVFFICHGNCVQVQFNGNVEIVQERSVDNPLSKRLTWKPTHLRNSSSSDSRTQDMTQAVTQYQTPPRKRSGNTEAEDEEVSDTESPSAKRARTSEGLNVAPSTQ